jgi:hypothetical protein
VLIAGRGVLKKGHPGEDAGTDDADEADDLERDADADDLIHSEFFSSHYDDEDDPEVDPDLLDDYDLDADEDEDDR